MRRLAVFLLLAACAFAQTSAPAPQEAEHFNLVAITVRGTQRYSDSEVLAASKLAPGMSVTQAELQQAANRLSDTGVFSSVAYQFASAPGGMRMTLELTDNRMLVPVMFQNLVWLPDDALLDAIRQRVPLFKGSVPLAGHMSKQVRDAIEAALAEKGVKVHVSQMLASTDDGSSGFAYRTDDVAVRIVAVDFAGRNALDPVLLGGVVDTLKQDHYFMPVTADAGKHGIQQVYLAQGYLGIKVSDPRTTLVDPSPTAPAVKLTFPLEEGKQYKLAAVQWKGNTAVPAAELDTKLSLTLGQPVNLPRLQRELGSARSLYLKQGYMYAGFVPSSQLHDDGTAVILVTVYEGAQFKMGELTVQGLDAATAQKLSAQWAIPRGAVYDDSYPSRFMTDTLGLLPPGVHYEFMRTTKINEEQRTVDVTVEYKH